MKPLTIAVLNTKGGVGKTTSAVVLAHLFGKELGRTCLVDLDRQASAVAWAQQAAENGNALSAEFKQVPPDAPPARLPRIVGELSEGFEYCLIDNPTGDIDRNDASVEVVTANGGIAVIPSGATDLDLPRALVTLEDIADRARAAILLTKTRSGTVALKQAREQLQALGADVLDSHIPLRQTIATAASGGISEAVELYEPVAHELFTKIGDQ